MFDTAMMLDLERLMDILSMGNNPNREMVTSAEY